jgi:squalene synthase HpnC
MAMPKPDPFAAARRAENFPVASRLMAPALRPVVLAFYRVARGADEIADDPGASPAAKSARLLELDAVLAGAAPAPGDGLAADCALLRRASIRHAVDPIHARHLLQAFLADAQARPCAQWSDLVAYCNYSAAPVGRFLLALHGLGGDALRASDALCAALQILNHIQDCRADWTRLGRCYVPTRWLADEGLAPDALGAAASGPGLRRVLHRMLDRVDGLLAEAAPLARNLGASGLARESAGIHAIATALSRRLRRDDPLARRVALPRWEKACRFLFAALRHGGGGGGSSFAIAMRLFPARARGPVAAIYAIARRLDDIADGDAAPATKLAALAAWRSAFSEPADPMPEEALLAALVPWDGILPRAEFLALIDGLEADSLYGARAPAIAELRLYCRQVAGSIGVLVLAAAGLRGPADIAYAEALGEALQLVNILRDIEEDAARGRLYVPAELIRQAGLEPHAPVAVLTADPRFAQARAALLALAQAAFEEADRRAVQTTATRLLAVRLIASTYRRLLRRLAHGRGPDTRMGFADRFGALVSALRGAT